MPAFLANAIMVQIIALLIFDIGLLIYCLKNIKTIVRKPSAISPMQADSKGVRPLDIPAELVAKPSPVKSEAVTANTPDRTRLATMPIPKPSVVEPPPPPPPTPPSPSPPTSEQPTPPVKTVAAAAAVAKKSEPISKPKEAPKISPMMSTTPSAPASVNLRTTAIICAICIPLLSFAIYNFFKAAPGAGDAPRLANGDEIVAIDGVAVGDAEKSAKLSEGFVATSAAAAKLKTLKLTVRAKDGHTYEKEMPRPVNPEIATPKGQP